MRVRNNAITGALDAVDSAKVWADAVVKEVQEACTHTDIAECPFDGETEFRYALPPWRVCVDCGLAEEGWGCGFRTLIDTSGYGVRQISRTDLFKIAVGRRIRQDD